MSLFSLFISADTFVASVIGLFVSVLYVVIDTQIIINKTEQGRFELFKDAKELFIDFIKIMIEVLNIISKLSEDKKKKDSNK
jgi:FtsH-binding integral membrane protein